MQKTRCPVCHKHLSKKWLKTHLKLHTKASPRQITEGHHHHTVIVDKQRGIYSATINMKGPSVPLHVQKVTQGASCVSFCEKTSCMQASGVAHRGGNISYECPHVKSVVYAVPGITPTLSDKSLTAMEEAKIITQDAARRAKTLCEEALSSSIPPVVCLPNPPYTSDRYIYLSVSSRKTRYWSRLKRTIVTFDKLQKCMVCRCCTKRVTCVHKTLAKWHFFQEQSDVLSNSVGLNSIEQLSSESDNNGEVEEDTACQEATIDSTDKSYPPSGTTLEKLILYLHKHKEYVDLQSDQYSPEEEFHLWADQRSVSLHPTETHCIYCNEPLTSSQRITCQGTIVTTFKIIKG